MTLPFEDLPDDMDPQTKISLLNDLVVFGTCFYEDTGGGYERRDPTETVIEDGEAPPGVRYLAHKSDGEVYGTSPVESLEGGGE